MGVTAKRDLLESVVMGFVTASHKMVGRLAKTKAMAVIRTDRGHGLAFGIKCVSRVKKDTIGVICSCNNGMGCRANIASPKG